MPIKHEIKAKCKNKLVWNEQGSSSLLTIIILFSISFTVFGFIQVRAKKDLDKLISNGLEENKLLVSRAIAYQADCNSIDFSTSCPGSSSLGLDDRRGNSLISNSGTKVGDWDVRVRCNSGVYQVELARLKSNGDFKVNSLTRQEYSWEVMDTLKNLCFRDRQVIPASPCYGTQGGVGAGHTQLPPHLLTVCQTMSPPGGFCNPSYYHGSYTYCPNNIGNYPGCPSGYQPELNYIDRFGWGGIDFTKMTVCVKTVN